MTSLYHLNENAQALHDLKLIAEEANNHDAAQAIDEAWELLQGELSQKLEQCVYILKEWEIDVAAQKAEIERLSNKRKLLVRRITDLKSRMLKAMTAAEMTKSKGALHTVSLRKTPGKLVIDDATAIPAAFMKQPDPVPDNAAIKRALLDGENLGYAHIETGETLGIK